MKAVGEQLVERRAARQIGGAETALQDALPALVGGEVADGKAMASTAAR